MWLAIFLGGFSALFLSTFFSVTRAFLFCFFFQFRGFSRKVLLGCPLLLQLRRNWLRKSDLLKVAIWFLFLFLFFPLFGFVLFWSKSDDDENFNWNYRLSDSVKIIGSWALLENFFCFCYCSCFFSFLFFSFLYFLYFSFLFFVSSSFFFFFFWFFVVSFLYSLLFSLLFSHLSIFFRPFLYPPRQCQKPHPSSDQL